MKLLKALCKQFAEVDDVLEKVDSIKGLERAISSSKSMIDDLGKQHVAEKNKLAQIQASIKEAKQDLSDEQAKSGSITAKAKADAEDIIAQAKEQAQGIVMSAEGIKAEAKRLLADSGNQIKAAQARVDAIKQEAAIESEKLAKIKASIQKLASA